MASNVIDYFATLGRKSLICKSFESLWVNDKSSSPSEIWNEAITDIAIVHQGEKLPDSSWQTIDQSIDNRPISSRSTIAVRRRGASKRLDHITKIKLIKKGDVIPLGFELIDRSITKMFPAEIDNVGALAIKRAHASEVTFIQGEPLVDDICLVLVNEGEEVPEGYVSLERTFSKEQSRAAKSSQGVPRIVLAYHQRPAMGLCDLSYESATLDRYPQKDQTDFPLPVIELPMFAFPHDLRLSYSSIIRFPLPVFFSFVFTNSKGMHRYAACLRFYEIVPKEEILEVFREVYGPEQDLILPASHAVFCPKIICVVSRMPFYRAMRRYLCQIFSMSLSSLPCPLEFFIASVVGQVPLPVAGGRPFHVVQDAALISSTSCAMNAIEFEVPLPRFFPPMDLDFAAPLRCLSVDRLLAVFALMLRETKIVFLCCSNTLLTETMETLRSLLFPLKWSSCFVSRLPDALSGLLEAPGGFMIGLHMFEDKENDVEVAESHVDKHFGDRKAVRQTQWTHSLTPGTFIVDLSSNAVFQYDGKREQIPLGTSAINHLVHSLPPGPRKRLQRKLQHIATSYHIGPQTVGLDRFDSAFDFQSYEDFQEPAAVSAFLWENFPTLEIRDYFMNFMADLLGNYQKYIIPPLEDMSADTYRTFKEEFSVEEYLNDAGTTVRLVLEGLVDTQMFAVLLQQRSEASDYSLVFFESAGELMREYKLQAGGHNVKDLSGGSFSSSNSIPDMPAPLYKLLAAKAWAAANGKYHQNVDPEKELMMEILGEHSPVSAKDHSDSFVDNPADSKFFSSLRRPPAKKLLVSSPSFRRETTKTKAMTPLDYLIIALGEMEIEGEKRSFQDNAETPGHSKKRGKIGARNELDKRANLRLHDRSVGPLIIPGPSKALLNTTLPHTILASNKKHTERGSDRGSENPIDDTNSVVTCSTDVSDDNSETLPFYCKAIADFGVTTTLNNEEINHHLALAALRTSNRSPLMTEESNEIEYESDAERDSEGRFSYQIGWPVLHSKLLKLARRSVHTRLSGLRKSRVFALQMINRNIQLFLRAPTEQWACYRSIAYTNERSLIDLDTSSSMHGPKSVSPVAPSQSNLRNILSGSSSTSSLAAESQFVISAVLEVLSVSLMLLCTRTLHEAKPVCDMLQVLGILAQADQMGILQKFDETIWRTLLVACASAGGDVMRKMACVIFDTLTACGITPDALTYGSYTRALAATKCSEKSNNEQMDQFLYLEEIGLAWFQQRSAVIEQSQSDFLVPEPRGTMQKSGMISSMFNRKKRPTVTTTRRRVSSRASTISEMTGASDTAATTAAQLGLIRPAAALSLLCPAGPFIVAPPRYAQSFQPSEAIEELSSELSGRIGKLMLDYKPPSPPSWDCRPPAFTSKDMKAKKLDINMFKAPEKVQNEERFVESEGNGNSESIRDLFGPAPATASTDSQDKEKDKEKENRPRKKSFNEDTEGRGAAYMSSALEAAVSTSSAAASSVKHFGSILIAGIPTPRGGITPRRSTTTAVPVEMLHEMIRGGTPSPIDSENELEISPPSPNSGNPSRMSRITSSFYNPFNVKDKDKEKVKDLLDVFSISGMSLSFSGSVPPTYNPPGTTTPGTNPSPHDGITSTVKTATMKVTSSLYSKEGNISDEIVTSDEKDRERRGSLLSIRFSDDEADDSDEESHLSRRTSSNSIREKNHRRALSFTADLNDSIEAGKAGAVTQEQINNKLNMKNADNASTMMSLKSFVKNINGTASSNSSVTGSGIADMSNKTEMNEIMKESGSSALFYGSKDEDSNNDTTSRFFQTPFSPTYFVNSTTASSPLEPMLSPVIEEDELKCSPRTPVQKSRSRTLTDPDHIHENELLSWKTIEETGEITPRSVQIEYNHRNVSNFDTSDDDDDHLVEAYDNVGEITDRTELSALSGVNGIEGKTDLEIGVFSVIPEIISQKVNDISIVSLDEPNATEVSAISDISTTKNNNQNNGNNEKSGNNENNGDNLRDMIRAGTLALASPTSPVSPVSVVHPNPLSPISPTTPFSPPILTSTLPIISDVPVAPPIPPTTPPTPKSPGSSLKKEGSGKLLVPALVLVPPTNPVLYTPSPAPLKPIKPIPISASMVQGPKITPAAPVQAPVQAPVPSTPVLSTPVLTANKRLNVLAMQTDLLSTFAGAFIREGSAIGIHCATPCPTCSYTLLDEEVMALWGGADHQGLGGTRGIRSPSYPEEMNGSFRGLSEKQSDNAPVNSITDMRSSDIEAAHCICCPACTSKYSPQLHISCYALRPSSAVTPFSPLSTTRLTTVAEWTPTPTMSPSNTISPSSVVPLSPEPSPLLTSAGPSTYTKKMSQNIEPPTELRVVWKESVPYLSPKGLRLALEEQMEGIGERVADPCWLHVHRPAVYWNILWFSSRLKVPTGFLATPLSLSPRVQTHNHEKVLPDGTRCGIDTEKGVNGAYGMNGVNGVNSVSGFNGTALGPGIGPGGPGTGNTPAPMWHLPTVIGWRESVVKAKVKKCLTKPLKAGSLSRSASLSSFSPESLDTLQEVPQLPDMFPGCDDVPLDSQLSPREDISQRSLMMKSSSIAPVLSPLPRSLSSPMLHKQRSNSITPSISGGPGGPGGPGAPMGPQGIQSPRDYSSTSSATPSTPMSTSKSTSPLRVPSMRLEAATEYLDGTAEGMRRAILEIGKYHRLISEAKNAFHFAVAASLVSESSESKTQEGGDYDDESKCIDDKKVEDMNIKSPRMSTRNGGIIIDNYTTTIESIKDPHAVSRSIYIDLLTLSYTQKCRRPESVGVDSSIHKNEIFKETQFENLYSQVVRDILTLKDFEVLGTTEASMLECVAGRAAQAYRIGLGFMF